MWCPRFSGHASVGVAEQRSDALSETSSVDDVIDLKGEQTESNDHSHSLNLDYKDLWALALATSIGGHYLPWNHGLVAGFGSFMVATFLIAVAYVSLMLCSAELSSALPFAGGAYGTARVTLGIFPGYLIGCMDTVKSVMFTSVAASTIGRMITVSSGGEVRWEPLYWLVFYGISLSIHCYGGRLLWRCFAFLSAIVVMLLLMYILGSSPYLDLDQHAPFYKDEVDSEYQRWFYGGLYEFMHVLPASSWFFNGIQSINIACGDVRNPKTEVPKGYLAAITTVCLTSFSVIIVACSVHPGTSLLKGRSFPLNRGYEKMFHITSDQASIISLPAAVSTGFGFMFFYGRQLRAMGESKLFNPIFAKELPGRHTPVGSLVIGSILGYIICIFTYIDGDYRTPLYNLSKLCAFTMYTSIFVSFLVFRAYYPTIKREFVSPLGEIGAYFGIAVFLLAFISVCGFQDTQTAVPLFVGLLILATAYYYTVVEKRQVFSEEEKTVMFKAYLVKGNASKAHRIKRGPRGAGRSGTHSDEPTPRSTNGKRDKEVSITRVHGGAGAAGHTDTASSVTATHHDLPLIEEKPAQHVQNNQAGHAVESGDQDGAVTLWQQSKDEVDAEMMRGLATLPV